MQISAYIAMIQSLTSEATDTRLQFFRKGHTKTYTHYIDFESISCIMTDTDWVGVILQCLSYKSVVAQTDRVKPFTYYIDHSGTLPFISCIMADTDWVRDIFYCPSYHYIYILICVLI